MCLPSPVGNSYICSKQALLRAKTSVRTPQFDDDILQNFEKNLHGWSCSQYESLSCVQHCTWAGAPTFPLVEGAGSTRPQRLPPSRPICSLVCAPEYREAQLSHNGVVHRWGLLHQRGDFQQPQQPCLGRSKPSCCTCSLPPTTLCGQCLGGQWLLDWALLVTLMAQCTDLLLPEIHVLEEILLSVRRNVVSDNRAAAHFACHIREHLTTTYNYHWIGWGRPKAWPPRSPDLTPKGLLPMGPHWSPDLHVTSWVWRSYCLYCSGSSNHQATTWHFWMHVSLCYVTVSCVLRSVAKQLHICSKLLQSTTFCQNNSAIFLDFQR